MTEEILSTRLVYNGRAVRLRVDTVRMPGGRETTREIVEHSDVVVMVAVDAEDNILLVNQFRHPVGKELLEIPAGGIDPGEEPAEAVCRELREETGFMPDKLEALGGFYSAPGYCTEYLNLYLATDLTYSPLHAEDTDDIKVVRIPVSQIPELITSGRIRDAKSIAGLLMYQEYWKARQP